MAIKLTKECETRTCNAGMYCDCGVYWRSTHQGEPGHTILCWECAKLNGPN